MATMTQVEVIQQLKLRVKRLKEENANLVNENEELNEALSSIYETSAGFINVDEDLEEMDFDEN